MPRCFGMFVIALGLAAGLSPTVLGDPINRYSRGAEAQNANDNEPPGNKNPAPIGASENAIERIARALEAANNQQKSPSDVERAERDLDAQEDMAKWAMWMTIISVGGLFVTATGVLLVWRTLIATREAAHYAKVAAEATKQAVVEAERATKAAQDSTLEARRGADASAEAATIAKASERAFVFVPAELVKIESYIGVRNSVSTFSIFADNIGRTPGVLISRFIDYQPFENFIDDRLHAEDDEISAVSMEIIPASGSKMLRSYTINNPDRDIHVYGYIRYRDAFGANHTTRFSMKIDTFAQTAHIIGGSAWHDWD